MPSYRTHVSINLCLGLPLSLAALKYGVALTPKEFVIFSTAYIYGTFFLHPDLDLARNIKLFSIKGILTLPFRPYSYLFSHRKISHIPIIGTLTRVIWLGLFLLLLPLPKIDETYIWITIFGWVVADIFHILLDRLK